MNYIITLCMNPKKVGSYIIKLNFTHPPPNNNNNEDILSQYLLDKCHIIWNENF